MENRTQPVINLQVGSLAYWRATETALQDKCTTLLADSWTSDTNDFEAVIKKLEVTQVYWQEKNREESERELVGKCSLGVFRLRRLRREVMAWAYSTTQEACEALIEKLKELFPEATRTEHLLDVTFWHYSEHDGPRSYDRQIHAPKWTDIQENYPPTTRAKLEKLWATEPDAEKGGKLILFQGKPGTGKTFALRALGEDWGDWCKVHFVLDPENLFSEGDYLLKVILGGDDHGMVAISSEGNLTSGQDVKKPEWRLIVLEDAGELVAKDAKSQVGQGLSRLLNLCEGLLGQGLRVMVLITTNEDLGSLHEAVVRPGRVLSQISFDSFEKGAAQSWLEAHVKEDRSVIETLPNKSVTLADLYAMLTGDRKETVGVAGFV